MASSELILNADGSIYHLGLHPKQVAPLIITVGDPDRVEQVSAHFDQLDFRVERREFVSHGGLFAGRPILCISTGIGTDNVDIVFNELDALVNVDLRRREVKTHLQQLTFLRLGTSGTFQASIAVDSLLVSSAALGLDGLGPSYHFASHPLERAFSESFPTFSASAYAVDADIELLQSVLSWSDVQAGATVTCAGFYGPQRRSLRLPFRGPRLEELAAFQYSTSNSKHPAAGLSNFEMETAGIYGLAALLGHRAISVSAILANRANGEFSRKPAETVDQLIQLAFAGLQASPSLWWGE